MGIERAFKVAEWTVERPSSKKLVVVDRRLAKPPLCEAIWTVSKLMKVDKDFTKKVLLESITSSEEFPGSPCYTYFLSSCFKKKSLF